MTILKQSNRSWALSTLDITPNVDSFLYIPRIFLIKRKSILEERDNLQILEQLQRSSDIYVCGVIVVVIPFTTIIVLTQKAMILLENAPCDPTLPICFRNILIPLNNFHLMIAFSK